MTQLLAKNIRSIEGQFLDLIEALPGTKVEKQSYFLENGIRVARTNYKRMWYSLVDKVGRVNAATYVYDYLLESADIRLNQLIEVALTNQPVIISERDKWSMHLLFYRNGKPKKICQYLLKYIKEQGRTITMVTPSIKTGQYIYDVAMSFAGENRLYVQQVAEILRSKKISLFYDDFEDIDLWGRNLAIHFDDVFRNKARYCLIFVSKYYVEKAWPRHELQSALARAIEEKGEYILPVRMDNSDIPGIPPTIGYQDARKCTPEVLVGKIIHKISK